MESDKVKDYYIDLKANSDIYKKLYLDHLVLRDYLKELDYDLLNASTLEDLEKLKRKYVYLKDPVFV